MFARTPRARSTSGRSYSCMSAYRRRNGFASRRRTTANRAGSGDFSTKVKTSCWVRTYGGGNRRWATGHAAATAGSYTTTSS